VNASPLFVRTHDLLLWLIPHVQKFPRTHRFGLGERIQRLALDFQDSLVAAGKNTREQRKNMLHQADIQLEQLRVWFRVSQELGLLTIAQYEHVSRMTAEVGRLLGAWIKQG
jgi:four helix bundle protein